MELDFTEGMQFDKGYISPYFVTDPERMEAVLEDAYILVHQSKISVDRRTCCRCWRRSCRPASRCSSSPRTSTARRSRRSSSTRSAARSTPSRSRRPASATAARPCCRTSPILTGGQVVAEEVGLKLDQVGLEVLGTARRVVVTKDDTTVDRRRRRQRTRSTAGSRQIRAEIERTDSDWDREKLQERLAKLAGGVCVIKVGAHTEVELKEKKHRIEDAVSATRAAIEEGIVAGGGSALVHAVSVLDDDLGLTGDEATGVGDRPQGRRRAAALDRRERRPRGLRRRRQGRASLPVGQGFNAATGEYGDLHRATASSTRSR